MQTIKLFIFILGIQLFFVQKAKPNKLYQLYERFHVVEDSISKITNIENSIIYKTCESSTTFFLIEKNTHWTGYFIKNLRVDGLNTPTTIDTLKNGEIIKFKPYETELLIFNADSIVKTLFANHINDIKQISEDSIQAKFIKKGRKKNEMIIEGLPQSPNDCNYTISIYGQKNISATYRGILIETESMHIIPTLKIFFETKQILINTTKNYSR